MSGFRNVILGLEHAPQHILDFIKSDESGILGVVVSGAVSELVAFEKANGNAQLEAAKTAGEAAFKAAVAAGQHIGPAIIVGVGAAFEAVVPGVVSELKTISTQAMTTLISSIV